MRPTAGADRTASRSAAGSDGQRLAVERRRPSRARPRRGRSRPRSAGASPERTFSSTSCSAKNATVSAAFGRSRSASTTRPSARTSSGNAGSGPASERRVGAADREHAPPARAPRRARARRAPGRRRRSAPARPARGARRPGRARSSAAARRTAPAPTTRRPSTSASPASAIACSVRLREGALAAYPASALRQRRLVHARRGHEPDHPQRGLGQRAGLVGADDVDRGERLDRVQLLREHAALRDLERRHRRGQADRAGSGPRARG